MLGVACAGGEGASAPRVLRVPSAYARIQQAVDAARPGDLVLVSPGTYRESVTVETPRLVIRGLDRTRVVIDGEDRRENGIAVYADGVAIENLTVRRARGNGVLFSGDYGSGRTLRGYRVRYVTATNNGLYGIYAFSARGGLIERVYASGHPDAGIYIGQCSPCDALLTEVTAERNAVGYQSTNAGGNLLVVRSAFRRNRVGVEPNSSTREELWPQRETAIVGNSITDNAAADAPRATSGFGVGVAVAGGQRNRVERNRVTGHPAAGIVVTSQESFLPEGNEVTGNVLTANAVDLVLAVPGGAALGNCFRGNRFASSSPASIETAVGCEPNATAPPGSPVPVVGPPDVDHRRVPPPPPQPSMPGASRAKAVPAAVTPPQVDLEAIGVPPA